MIERLQGIARRLRLLRAPLLVLGLLSLALLLYTLLTSASRAEDRWLMPSLIALVWAMSTFGFIGLFQHVPPLVAARQTWAARLAHRAHRAVYMLLALVYLLTTLAALYLSQKALSVWLTDFGGP